MKKYLPHKIALRETRNNGFHQWIPIISVLLLLVAWELASAYMRKETPLGDKLFPSLLTVFSKSWVEFSMFSTSDTVNERLAALEVLLQHSWITAMRVFIGAGLGVLIGMIIGLAIAYDERIRYFFSGPLSILRPIAGPAVIPLFTLWFAGSEAGYYALIGYLTFVVVVISSIHAAQHVEKAPQKFAVTMGASKRKVFKDVILPGMFPEVFGSLRVVFAMGWSFALAAEYVAAQKGLGFLMIKAGQFGFLGRVVVIVILFTIFAVITDKMLVLLRNRMLRWQS